MKRSNLIPITRIYDIYPKYTYSEDVKKFMDEIVDIDRVNVYSEDEVIAILDKIKTEIQSSKDINGQVNEHTMFIRAVRQNIIDKYEVKSERECALEKAYRKGYYDALQRQKESEE